ncbi:Snf5- protein 1 [Geranomyces variabilis]|nr:Snf5- protein 1 [Geranomyces variabilis]
MRRNNQGSPDSAGDYDLSDSGDPSPSKDSSSLLNNAGSTNPNRRNLGDFKYRADPRVRTKGAAHTYSSRTQLQDLADRTVQLVPVRLDLEVEGVKLRDQFTWNLNETLITPEHFAQLLADDFDSPYAPQFVPLIAEEIRRQVQSYGAAVEEDPAADGAPRIIDDEHDESSYGEIRIVIKLDLNVGALHLRDQFEWPLFSTSSFTPEDFAKQLAGDLGVGGEFVPIIAHAVREQVCFARMNWDDATPAPPIKGRPFRSENFEEDWEPELRELSEAEMERISREKERNTRRLRRQHRSTLGRTASSSAYSRPETPLAPTPANRPSRAVNSIYSSSNRTAALRGTASSFQESYPPASPAPPAAQSWTSNPRVPQTLATPAGAAGYSAPPSMASLIAAGLPATYAESFMQFAAANPAAASAMIASNMQGFTPPAGVANSAYMSSPHGQNGL